MADAHPSGATGLGMHFYITSKTSSHHGRSLNRTHNWLRRTAQLRNWSGPMQAPGLFDIADKRGKYGLVHNIGLGGAVVVSLLRRPDFWVEGGVDGRQRCVIDSWLLFWRAQEVDFHVLSSGWGTTMLMK